MSPEEMLPAVRTLPRGDKFRLMQVLVVELAREEETPSLEAGKSYPVWTPHNAFDAAAVLSRYLESSGGSTLVADPPALRYGGPSRRG